MSDIMEYKGYFGSVRYSDDDEVLHGKIEFIRDLVTYEGRDAKGLKRAFREAVDDYIALCTETGARPIRRSRAASMCEPARTSPQSDDPRAQTRHQSQQRRHGSAGRPIWSTKEKR